MAVEMIPETIRLERMTDDIHLGIRCLSAAFERIGRERNYTLDANTADVLKEFETRLKGFLDEARYEGVEYEEPVTAAEPESELSKLNSLAEDDGEADDSGELDEAALRAEDETDIAERYSDLSELEKRIILAFRPVLGLTEPEERDLAKAIAAVTSSKAESDA